MPGRLAILLITCLASLPAGAEPLSRTPWTTSRIAGSPEPPKPFTTVPVFTGLELHEALELIAVPGQGRMLAVEKAGQILSFPNQPKGAVMADLVIDLKASHPKLDYAYGVAFHPRYRENREIFLTYTEGAGHPDGSKLSRFRLSSLEPPIIDPASEEIVLTWRSGGHNGANVRFGPDGFLYLSTGDSEVPAPPDPLNTGQDISDLLSSILRIDVDRRDAGRGYHVPEDNPFLAIANARPEVWCYGVRNPWKMSFDPATGNLWCGDVGWEQWEMIHLIRKGGNYGWSAREASQLVRSDTPSNPAPITPPVVAHPHSEAASITGGFVYRGKAFPELQGAYVYGDYETGKIWALWHDGVSVTRKEEIADTPHKIVTFGEDEAGELYVVHWSNPSTIHALARHETSGARTIFPRKLSESGLFWDTPKQIPAPGVYPYEIAAPLWQEGAIADRFAALPGSAGVKTSIERRKDGSIANVTVTWPVGSVLARTVKLAKTKVETQILHFDGEAWNGYSYRWNEAGSDADLVPASGLVTGTWTFPARGECGRCHNSWSGFALGFQPPQLTAIASRAAEPAALSLGLVDHAFFERSAARLKANGPVEDRARAWLHANCAHCHRQNGGGSVAIMLNAELALNETRLVEERPFRGEFGLPEARVIAPGVPWRSVLLNRVMRSGSGHMPATGAREPDPDAIRLLRDWIASMPPSAPEIPGNAVGDAMKAALSEEKQAIVAGLASPDPNIHELFERFRPPSERPKRIDSSTSEAALLALRGDPERGRKLLTMNGKMAVCLGCHFVLGQGRDFGPDLSKVGARLTKQQILASLLRPSEAIDPRFRGIVLETSDGQAQTGFIAERRPQEIVFKLPSGQATQVSTDLIRKEEALPISLMPEQLLLSLTPDEGADLLAYLASLR
jgi:putative heme-binding domain-containing protein